MSSLLTCRPRYFHPVISQQYEPVFLGTQVVNDVFLAMPSPRIQGATSAPPALAIHRRPPSTPAPRRLPVAWPAGPIRATIRNALWKAAFAPASILGRRKMLSSTSYD